MIVRVDDLKPEGLRVDTSLHIGSMGGEEGLELEVGDVRVAARIRPSRGGMACEGRIEGSVSIPCSRCLARYALPVERDFNVSYLPAPDARGAGGFELQISREDLDVSYLDEEGKLDMRDLVSEQIYLALPMKPLCALECRGLCASCGANLNTETCRCRQASG